MDERAVILAIETATRTGSIALLDGARVTFYRDLGSERATESLAEVVHSAVEEELGGEPARITTYALSIGPGSFTGLRVGLAFLKGFAMVHPRPVFGVSTLDVIASGIANVLSDGGQACRVLAMLDARQGDVFAAAFRLHDGELASDPVLPEGLYSFADVCARLDDPVETVVGGDDAEIRAGFPVRWAVADRSVWTPDARVLAAIARHRAALGTGEDVVHMEPVYHQRSAAEVRHGESSH